MTLHAIPTKYAGTQFRSRLEARGARFFDLVGWRWEYEPFDLNGWIPDFALVGASAITLVEVKPIARLDDPIAVQACAKAEYAVRESGHLNEILLLGFTWPNDPYIRDCFGAGWLGEWMENTYTTRGDEIRVIEGWSSCWAVAPFHDTGGLGFHHSEQSWCNRITGQHDGDRGAFAEAPIDQWREAGNTVQWRPSYG